MKVDRRETQAGGGSESYNIALRLKNQKNALSVTKKLKATSGLYPSCLH